MTGMFRAIGKFARWIRLFRIAAAVIVLSALSPFVLVYLGYGPSPEQIEDARQALDAHAAGLSVLRFMVYLVMIWYGPVWRGVREWDLDRARINVCVIAVTVELVLVQRLFIF